MSLVADRVSLEYPVGVLDELGQSGKTVFSSQVSLEYPSGVTEEPMKTFQHGFENAIDYDRKR